MATTVAVFTGAAPTLSNTVPPTESPGASQTWVVPSTVTQVTVYAWGAGSTSVGTAVNPQGGFVSGVLTVTPGDTYYAVPGTSSGANGGGARGTDGNETFRKSTSGGGATDLRHGGTALVNRLLVAGGAGGTGNGGAQFSVSATEPTTPNPPYNGGTYYDQTASSVYAGFGGWSGSPAEAGQAGNNGAGTAQGGVGGGAGTQTGGGAAGTDQSGVTPTTAAVAGALGQGGDGSTKGSTTSFFAGGGGGGGYYGGGGGGGGDGASGGGGGGGGSNFADPTFTSVVNQPHALPTDSIAYFQALNTNGTLSTADLNTIKTALNSGQGVLIILFDNPPNAPAFTAPANNAYFDSTQTLEIDWTFSSSVGGQTQSGFDIQYEDTGILVFTTITQRTNTASKYVFPANTFTAGHSYEIQVRTYDTNGSQGPWGTLFVNALSTPPPGAPTVTAPTNGQQFTASPFNVTWTIDGGATELTYRVKIKNAAGGLISDTLDTPSSRVNLSTNPGFETNATGWSAATGTPTIASSTAFAKFGTHSGLVTWSAGSANNQSVISTFSTIPGLKYSISVYLTAGNVATDPTGITVQATDTTGVISSAVGTIVTAGTFIRVEITFTARNTSSSMVITPNGTVAASSKTYVDGALFELNANTARSYFDGGNANGNTGTPSWTGTANNSTSVLTTTNVLTYSVTWGTGSASASVEVSYSTVASSGISSAVTSHTFTVNFNPPGAGSAVATGNAAAGTITLVITNGTGVATNDVYRTDVTHGLPEIRIAKGLGVNATFVDYTPATNTLYTYRVRQYSTSGGYTDIT